MEINEVFEELKIYLIADPDHEVPEERGMGLNPDEVTMDAKLEEDLEIDSLGIVEIVMWAEDKWGIEVDDEELKDVSTVGQAVNVLHSKI